MKSLLLISVSIMTFAFCDLGTGLAYSAQLTASQKQGRGKDLRVVKLEGAPYERGLMHGKTLKREIGEVVGLWKAALEKEYKMKPDVFIAAFQKNTNFTKEIKKWTPELLDEVRGIADGSGIDFSTIYVFQLMDEIWMNGSEIAAEHCTSIGVNRRGGNPALVAQNMDIPLYYHGFQTLLHIKDQDSESFVLTVPGMIALNGMNNSPVAVNVNTLSQLRHAKEGLPVAFVIRGVLQRRSLEDAAGFIRGINHASGQNYIIGDENRAQSFESSAGKVTEYRPYPNADRVYHTNHPMANDDFDPKYLERLAKRNKTTLEGGYYCYRFEAAERRLRDRAKTIDLATVKDTLGSRDYEDDPAKGTKPISQATTYASVIMVLSETPTLHIAPGNPHLTPYKTFTFSEKSKADSK